MKYLRVDNLPDQVQAECEAHGKSTFFYNHMGNWYLCQGQEEHPNSGECDSVIFGADMWENPDGGEVRRRGEIYYAMDEQVFLEE